ncbi:MAG: HEAT repeat domain-containing protein [Polyangiales bacterium]
MILGVPGQGPAQGPASRGVLPYRGAIDARHAAVQVSLQAGAGACQVQVRRGARRWRFPLPLVGCDTGRWQRWAIGNGRHVLWVEAEQGAQRAGLLLASTKMAVRRLWSDHTDARGDPGETQAGVLRLTPASDAAASIVIGRSDARVPLCGQGSGMLAARRLDAAQLVWEAMPAAMLRPGRRNRLPPLIMQRVPTAAPPSPSRAFLQWRALVPTPIAGAPEHKRGAAAAVRIQRDAEVTALWDGQLQRGMTLPGDGTGTVVSGRWLDTLRPLHALFIAASAGVAGRLWLLTQTGRWRLLQDAAATPLPGQAGVLWRVVLPAPMPAGCLALVVAGPVPPESSRAPARAAKVTLYELWGEAASQSLPSAAALLTRLRRAAGDSVRVWAQLQALGDPGLRAVRAGFASLPPRHQRRALAWVAAQLAHKTDIAGWLATQAVTHTDPAMRRRARRALQRLGPAATPWLVRAIQSSHRPAPDSFVALGQHAPRRALALALQVLAEGRGPVAAAARPWVATLAAAVAPDEAQRMVADWRPPLAVAANVALAWAARQPALCTDLLRRYHAVAQGFSDRWRLLQAAGCARGLPEVRAWLVQQALHAKPWMLRKAALLAWAQHGSVPSAQLRQHLLRDPYPRVRAAAVDTLVSPRDLATLEGTYTRAAWPLVRRAVIRRVAAGTRGRALLRRAVDDPAYRVRAAAIRRLTRLRDRSAVSAVVARLGRDDEWPRVLHAAIAYVARLRLRAAQPRLWHWVQRGQRPGAWSPDTAVAAHAARVWLALHPASQRDRAAKRLPPSWRPRE